MFYLDPKYWVELHWSHMRADGVLKLECYYRLSGNRGLTE